MRETSVDIIRRLVDAGYEAYLVGGCVRDELRGVAPQDFDIATSATPVGISALSGRSATLLLWAVWIGAGIGVGLRLLPFHPPKGLMNSLFLGLGWVPIVVAPDLFRALEPVGIFLLVVEGLLYSGGALMLGARWPDPSPRVFGYHEVWHTLVTAAVAVHFVLVAIILG